MKKRTDKGLEKEKDECINREIKEQRMRRKEISRFKFFCHRSLLTFCLNIARKRERKRERKKERENDKERQKEKIRNRLTEKQRNRERKREEIGKGRKRKTEKQSNREMKKGLK